MEKIFYLSVRLVFLRNIMLKFAYYLQECYAKSDNLDLPSYLITPVQRLPRYVLLLRVCFCLAFTVYLLIHPIFLFEFSSKGIDIPGGPEKKFPLFKLYSIKSISWILNDSISS